MANQDSPELAEFKLHMRSIRNSDYRAALGLIKTDLGLYERVCDSEIEALLIFATRDCLAESLDADMVLSAFGFLKGFDNQHNPDGIHNSNALVTERRRKFIRESSYVADRHGPNNKRRKVHYQSYGELEAAGETAIDDVIGALGSEDGNLINRVAKKLYSYKRQISSYLEKSKKYLDTDEEGDIIGVKLQNLIHVNQDKPIPEITPIENFPPASQPKPENESESQTQPKPEPKPNPDYIRIQKQRDAAIATTVVLFITLCCIGVWSIYSNYKASIDKNDLPSVKRIILSKEDITVKPGIPEELEPTVIPNEAGIDGLECEPKNKNLVRVENFRIVVNDGWQEETDYTTTIKVYVKDDVDIYAEATVTVQPPVNIPDPPPSDIHNPILGGRGEKNANSSWND